MIEQQEQLTQTALVLTCGWTVAVRVDEEKRLGVLIFQADGSSIVEIGSGKTDGTDGQPLDLCFTSEQIEEEYASGIVKSYHNASVSV